LEEKKKRDKKNRLSTRAEGRSTQSKSHPVGRGVVSIPKEKRGNTKTNRWKERKKGGTERKFQRKGRIHGEGLFSVG